MPNRPRFEYQLNTGKWLTLSKLQFLQSKIIIVIMIPSYGIVTRYSEMIHIKVFSTVPEKYPLKYSLLLF